VVGIGGILDERTMRSALIVLVCVLGCGPKVGPSIDPIADVSAPVGVELQLALHGSSPDGRITFDFAAPDLPDLTLRRLAPTITNYAEGDAVFRWTPLADDVGDHEIDFTATGSGGSNRAGALIHVVPGPGAPPVFRVPVGEGTTLDLGRDPCAEVDVLVEDPDQAEVMIALEPPVPDNATLMASGPNGAAFRFCPTAQLVMAQAIYPIALSATDGTYVTIKPYTIVVRPASMAVCTTAAPVITTTPHGDITTTGNLHIYAQIADDVGVTATRVLWSTSAPADPKAPDLNALMPLTFMRKSGDVLSGMYEAVIPNPVVSLPSGTVKTIYYVIEADDADPPIGCAHAALSPAMGIYSFQVKRP
jgi:hypothetical protein